MSSLRVCRGVQCSNQRGEVVGHVLFQGLQMSSVLKLSRRRILSYSGSVEEFCARIIKEQKDFFLFRVCRGVQCSNNQGEEGFVLIQGLQRSFVLASTRRRRICSYSGSVEEFCARINKEKKDLFLFRVYRGVLCSHQQGEEGGCVGQQRRPHDAEVHWNKAGI